MTIASTFYDLRHLLLPPLRLFLALAVVGLSACHRQGSDASFVKVVGPEAREVGPGEWDSVVLIRSGFEICSGVLLSPTLVVTVAHCVESRLPESFRVFSGTGREAEADKISVGVSRVGFSPFYRQDWGGNADLGYLVLEQPLPGTSSALVLSESDDLRALASEKGRETIVVGYGLSEAKTSGIKFASPVAFKTMTGSEVYMGDARGDACRGDSGGPVFLRRPDGSFAVLGLTSRGPDPCGSDQWAGAWSLLAWHLCWVQRDSGIELDGLARACAPAGSDGTVVATMDLVEACHLYDAVETNQGSARGQTWRPTMQALRAAYAQAVKPGAAADYCSGLAFWAESLAYLDLSARLLQDLNLLRFFPNLERLNIEDNLISDVTPLRSLSKLRYLHTAFNSIADFAVLAEQQKLGLTIKGQGLQRGGEVQGYQDFLSLCLSADDPALKATILAIRKQVCYGSICDCRRTADRLRLFRDLEFVGEDIVSLEPLRGLDGIHNLRLKRTSIVDLAPLADMENLRRLDLTDHAELDLSPLAALRREGLLQVRGATEGCQLARTCRVAL